MPLIRIRPNLDLRAWARWALRTAFVARRPLHKPSSDIASGDLSKSTSHPSSQSRYSSDINRSALLPGELLVGQPDPISNIRPAKYYVPPDESDCERAYRQMLEEAHQFNHEFWKQNNERFIREKELFEQQVTNEKGKVSPEDLSVFYKRYLQGSRPQHAAYNKEWWRRNLAMIVPGIRAWAISLIRYRARSRLSMAKHAEQGFFDLDSSKNPVNDNRRLVEHDNVNRRKEKIRSYY
ncbi:Apoptogenic protein 1, mitochondrial [Spiromyces aspiralis]|uniref:Apoptogenic protein 1, mitochondrial n=1 Tax=Spiromyces aspiralis TaxID=68401 RepID=A0ACC1HXW4_9FUNG|nr:Apoptogenic protein 1, mitochondrial [Spiromyces aspiralis]